LEPIADPEEQQRNRSLARRVMVYALVTAVVATGLFAVATLPLA